MGEDHNEVDFDEVLEKIGNCGRYQRLIYFTVCLVGFPVAFNNMGIVFLAGVPEHWCAPDPALTKLNLTDQQLRHLTAPLDDEGEYDSCKMYDRSYSTWSMGDILRAAAAGGENHSTSTISCQQGWHYDTSLYESTIVTEWDLVCDRKWLVATASSVYMAGLMFGVLIFGTLSDLYGRRPSFISGMVLMEIFNIALAFSPNYTAFIILRFMVGVFSISLFTTGFVIGLEIVGQPWRVHAGISIEYYWAGGYMLYALVAYAIRDWFTLHLVTATPCVLLFLIFIILPESPRWLYTNKKREAGDAMVRKMAKYNKVELPDKMEVTVRGTEKKGYIWDLVRTPTIRYRSFNLFFNWFVNSLVYYGLSLNTSNLGGDPYVNFFISAAVEIPAYIFCQLALMYMGRRWPLSGTMLLGGIALLCTMAVPEELNWISITLAMFGKFCISASFAIIYVFSGELYPTIIRNVGVGTGSFFARVGGVIAPYIGQLSDYGKVIPLIVFGSLSLLAGLLVLFLPETKGKHLPETIEDGENFGKDQKLCCGSKGDPEKYMVEEKSSGKTPISVDGSVNPAFETTNYL